jgi:hypothetical protein
MRKRYANMSGEDRKRLSEKLTGENNPNFGNRGSKNPLFKVKKTDTHKLNISKALKGREFSDQHKINISKSKLNKEPWNKGLKTGSLSDQHKENLSKSLKGISNDHKKNAIICENIYFESIIQASKYFEVSSTAILQRINSETSRWESYKYFDEKIHNINNYTAYNEFLKKPNNTGDQRSRKISCEGIVFNSLKEAREHFGVNSSSTIKNRIDSKLDRWKDYFYINQ